MGVIRLHRYLVCLAFVTLALDAAAEAPAAALLPSAVVDLLPPGTRRPLDSVEVSKRSCSYGGRAVERISTPVPTDDAPHWLEF